MTHLADKKFHFIGVGGIGMCGLAQLLQQMGAQVSGSDLQENKNTQRLRQAGVQIFIGHRPENVGSVDVVVFSSAVPVHNPEMVVAREQKIPLIPRAEALAELMRARRGVAIAGTHGKTTTTAMLGTLLLGAEQKPTIICGGQIESWGSTTQMGTGEWFVAEADESDGSFTKLSPEFAILTNIDLDHMDFFGSEGKLMEAFGQFIEKVPFYGALIACGDDSRVRQLLSNYSKRVITYGVSKECDWCLEGDTVFRGSTKVTELSLSIPGRHNAVNALGALALSQEIGVHLGLAVESLRKFKGVIRRFQEKGRVRGLRVYDDYAHHPTEIRATIQAFREKFPKQKFVLLFQPHRFSRTQACWDEFLECFDGVDELFISEIYPAGEAPLPGIDGQTLAQQIKGVSAQFVFRSEVIDVLERRFQTLVNQGYDEVIFATFGAGDCWRWGEELLLKLQGTIKT